MSGRLKTIENEPPSIALKELLNEHSEILIIYADSGKQKSNLAVFSKLANKNGVLASYLAQVLNNLLTNGYQTSDNCKSKASSGA